MKLFSKEHYELIEQFEKQFTERFDKEDQALWHKGIIYQDGRVNELFLAFRQGYTFGEFANR